MLSARDPQWLGGQKQPPHGSRPGDVFIAPQFAGVKGSKPWERRVTACIPHIETIEPLKVCIDLLRVQTERPHIMVIDTGSSSMTLEALEELRAADLEIHRIAAHGWRHSSEPVTAALDMAHALCRTEYLFHTHSDCFLRRHDFLEEMVSECGSSLPVMGYRMSPRDWATDEWEWMVGHTATLLHMPTMHAIGATWSWMRMAQFGYPIEQGRSSGWPDTETGFNHVLRKAGISPLFIGHDENGKRQVDENIDHVRSYVGSKLYSENYFTKAAPWMEAALTEARARIKKAKCP